MCFVVEGIWNKGKFKEHAVRMVLEVLLHKLCSAVNQLEESNINMDIISGVI